MPGFTFSPTMVGQRITLIMKGGSEIDGEVKEANPIEVVLKVVGENKLLRVNRDKVDAYTGIDEVKRVPDPLRLHVTRCCNMTTKCNGVKKLAVNPGNIETFKDCKSRNEYCQCFMMNFFDLQKQAQIKLLNGLCIGSYPESMKKEE